MKLEQAAACDGEQLRIQCNEDYAIDVIQVEYTVVMADGPQSGAGLPELATSRKPACPPREALSLSSSSLASLATSGNGSQSERQTATQFCNQREANEAQRVRAEYATSLLRNECRSMNSCSVDLRWHQLGSLARSTTVNSSIAGAASNRANPSAGNNVSASLLAKLLSDDPCPANRKLVEVIYKCRPLRFNKRVACRNSQLQLACPAGRQLMLLLAEYGSWPSELSNQKR